MSENQQRLNEFADRQPAEKSQPSDGTDPLAPRPASPEDPELENDEPGRLSRLADTALITGKQVAAATVSRSRKAAEAAGTTAASTARIVGETAKTAATGGVSAGQAIGSSAEKAVAASTTAAQTISSSTAKAGVASGRAVAAGARWLLDSTSERTAQLFAAAQGLVASDLSPQLNDLVQAAVKGKATIYDKAMDAVFLETHIGGGNHRLFDGGHTLWGAIKATHGASADDSLIQEALGGMQGLLRDVSTPKGLPLANWDKPTYDSVADSLQSTFGIPKDWFYDLNSYDVGDLLGGTVGVISLIFGWNKAETESFASLATGMGMSAAVGANPLLLAVSVVAFGRAFHKANHADEYVELAEGGLKGVIGTGSSLGAIALVGVAGGPAGVAMLAGVAAGVLAHAATKDVTLDAISRFVKEDAATVTRQISQQAIAIGGAIGGFAANSSRTVAVGTAKAGELVAGSVSTVGRLTATQTATAGRSIAGGARATGRLTTRAAAATTSSIGSAAERAKEFVNRDPSVDLEDDESEAPST